MDSTSPARAPLAFVERSLMLLCRTVTTRTSLSFRRSKCFTCNSKEADLEHPPCHRASTPRNLQLSQNKQLWESCPEYHRAERQAHQCIGYQTPSSELGAQPTSINLWLVRYWLACLTDARAPVTGAAQGQRKGAHPGGLAGCFVQVPGTLAGARVQRLSVERLPRVFTALVEGVACL